MMSSEIKNNTLIPAAIIVAGLIIAGAIVYSNSNGELPGGSKSAAVGESAGDAAPSVGSTVPGEAPVDISEDDDPFKGDANAPVVIIEFSDFQCPYCGKFVAETLPQIEKEYIDTGKTKIVFRDYPLPFHSNAQKAAEATECADEQGKFWEMHDIIFANQTAISVSDLKGYASRLGLNTGKFNSCLDSGKYEEETKKDLADGQAVGVSGTPTFFINGKMLVGAQPFEAFKEIIDAELE